MTIGTSATPTISFTNAPSAAAAPAGAGSMTLIMTNGGTGSVGWTAGVKWPSDVAPALTATGVDILTFTTIDGGTNVYGFIGGLNFS